MTDFILANYPAFKGIHFLLALVWGIATITLCASFMGFLKASKDIFATRKLLRKKIILPSMILTLLLGVLFLAANPSVMTGQGWMHGKLLLLFFFFGVHGFLVGQSRKAENGVTTAKPVVFRIILTLSILLPVIIVILALFKPF